MDIFLTLARYCVQSGMDVIMVRGYDPFAGCKRMRTPPRRLSTCHELHPAFISLAKKDALSNSRLLTREWGQCFLATLAED